MTGGEGGTGRSHRRKNLLGVFTKGEPKKKIAQRERSGIREEPVKVIVLVTLVLDKGEWTVRVRVLAVLLILGT